MAKKNKTRTLLIKITATIFLFALAVYFWQWFNTNVKAILIISGSLLTLYFLLFPEFRPKKFFNSMTRGLGL